MFQDSRPRSTRRSYLAVLLCIAGSASSWAAEVRSDFVAGDPFAEQLVEKIAEARPEAAIEVQGKLLVDEPVTGRQYTVLKMRVGGQDQYASVSHETGAFALDR